MDQRSKLQHFSVLNFGSAVDMTKFMEFLVKHMEFTEKIMYFTIIIGDIVEQSIRYTNLEKFEENSKQDKINLEIRKQHLDEIRKQMEESDESVGGAGMPDFVNTA